MSYRLAFCKTIVAKSSDGSDVNEIASNTCKNDTIHNIPRDTSKSIYSTQ